MKKVLLCLLLGACAGADWTPSADFQYVPVKTQIYTIATWQKINNPKNNRIHVYVEGDGHSFDSYGMPTTDPTPRGTFMRDLAMSDDFDNVVYVARPCQYIMDDLCEKSDWTDGRFSKEVIDAETYVINEIVKNKRVTLIGYSGGGFVSGAVIKQNPKMRVEKWITIAGVLNHGAWTEYFGDEPLTKSIELGKLPDVPQTHYVGERDSVVPYELAKTWADEKDIILVPRARHDNFGNLKIFD
jgi:hypothetical protein